MKKKMFSLALILMALSIQAQAIIYNTDDLYSLALKNNPRYFEKTALEKAAGFRVREIKSKGAPTLNFETTLSYITNPETLTVDAGSFGIQPILMPQEDTSFEMTGNTYYDFKLVLDQPVFTWGKIHNSVQAGKEGAAAATLDSMKMREQIHTEIMINCSTLQYLKKIELAASKQSEVTSRLEIIAEDSYNNGMILQTEYLNTAVRVNEAELRQYRIRHQIEQVVLNLTYLTGVELTPVMIETLNMDVSEPGEWQSIYRTAIENNRDLAMLRHSISGEEYRNKIGKGTYYFKPDLALHMELSYSGSYFPFFQEGWDENRGNLTITLALQSPLADFGGMYNSVKASEEELIAARASYETYRVELERVIKQTLSDMELNQLNLEFYRNRMNTDSQIINQKEKEWKSGYGDEKDYLIQLISNYSTIILMNREQIQLETNHITLKNISGMVNK